MAGGEDQRRGPTTEPANALTKEEEDDIVALLDAEEFTGLSPHQVVAKLADMNIYKASERTMYRILRRQKLLRHRDRSRPRTRHRPHQHAATGPRQVWSWDITYLRTPVKGRYWLLYMIVDVWSRKTVAARVHPNESDELASALIEETYLREGAPRGALVIHSDSGPAMKGKTVLAMMQDLGIVLSFSRPRVSDDNPFSHHMLRCRDRRQQQTDRSRHFSQAARPGCHLGRRRASARSIPSMISASSAVSIACGIRRPSAENAGRIRPCSRGFVHIAIPFRSQCAMRTRSRRFEKKTNRWPLSGPCRNRRGRSP